MNKDQALDPVQPYMESIQRMRECSRALSYAIAGVNSLDEYVDIQALVLGDEIFMAQHFDMAHLFCVKMSDNCCPWYRMKWEIG